MKAFLVHASYFVALIFLSFFSFFFIFGLGFIGRINLFYLSIPLGLSMIWVGAYTWSVLRLKFGANKVEQVFNLKNPKLICLLLTGIITVFGLFLSTLFPFPTQDVPAWIFLGTPAILLLFWCWLLYRFVQNKRKRSQWIMKVLHFLISLTYTFHVCIIYYIHFFTN
ncbi:hypothetical protein EV213_104194 [Aureibacillus halotolerans]|uniref:Uncharacterized protein n=1 Tax=Aureibacillus halotolerans TaxID=1508390 RepID=A0A4R6U608_9BACI|nr:hypothetical protein EV213_104194 [Aureibacillus halotolerans]